MYVGKRLNPLLCMYCCDCFVQHRNFLTPVLTYASTNVLPVVTNSGDFGESFSITAFFRSNGPSTIPNATLSLSLPLRFTPSVYSLYPIRVEVCRGCIGYNVNVVNTFFIECFPSLPPSLSPSLFLSR